MIPETNGNCDNNNMLGNENNNIMDSDNTNRPSMKPDVVISGISGQFPLSHDIENFKENLFAGVDMVTADDARWPLGFHRLPLRNGKVYGMDQFDNDFFGLSDEDALLIDPQDRLLMEEVYSAIIDAGVNPKSLKGSNTGYFHGACYTETHRDFESAETVPEGKFKALVTRIPRFLGLRGPVLDVDTACGSGLSSFSEAYHSIKNGICDQAIATASNTVFRPRISSQFRDLKMITKDGKCKCLDASADGYVRSEAVVATFLQKSSDAKRIYCYLLACRSNSDGFKEEGITFPSTKGQIQLLRDTYKDAGINPADIDYIEAHITGTKAGDPVETNAMYDVICSQREDPVMIGCLKSNIGHTEGSSGLCAISKACIIYQTRLIPPNIHYNTPNMNLKGLKDGKMQPVTKATPFSGHYIPVNCFGFGGANTHLITSDFVPGKNISYPSSCNKNIIDKEVLPYRLINVCGRTKESVEHIFNSVISKPMYQSREFLSLLNDFSISDASDFPCRGFMIARQESSSRFFFEKFSVKECSSESSSSPLLTISFPGPDAASAAAFDSLKRIACFKKMHETLSSVKREVPSSPMTEAIAKSVAFQLAFVDLLKSLDVEVDKVIGQSTGELTCAYFDGIIQAETALTAALKIMDGIDPYLQAEIIKQAKRKEDDQQDTNSMRKWSSSREAFSSSPEKLTERMTRFNHSVMFDGESPGKNQVFLQVDSRFSVKSSRSSFFGKKNKKSCDEIADSESDPVLLSLIKSLGHLYQQGINIKRLDKLYPQVSYPMPASTPFLSPLIKWNHSKPCSIKPFLFDANAAVSYQTTKNIVFRFDQSRSEDGFIFDHKIDGRVLFPATGYLMIAWSALSKMNKTLLTEFPVRFDSVKFMRAVVVSSESETILSVRINEDTGSFEIKESDNIIVSGKITAIDPNLTSVNQVIPIEQMKPNVSNELTLEAKDIYKELRIRGYDYGPYFQAIQEASSDASHGKLVWRDVISKTVRENLALETGEDVANLWIKSWCSFTDSLLQLQLIQSKSDSRCLFVPTSIDTLLVFPEEIRNSLTKNTFLDQMTQQESSILDVYQNHESGILFTDGLVIKGFKGSLLQRKKQQVKLLKYNFHPWNLSGSVDELKSIRIIEDYAKAVSKSSALDPRFDSEDQMFSFLNHLRKEKECESKNSIEAMDSNNNENPRTSESEDECKLSFDRDILFGKVNNGFTLHQQKFFKSALDIIVYNLISSSSISPSKIEVLEVNPSATSMTEILSERVKECLNDHVLYNQYSVVCNLLTNKSSLPDEVRQEYKDVIEVTEKDLVSAEENSSLLKNKIPSSHITFLHATSEDERNLQSYMSLAKQAVDGLKSEGFLLILYREKMDDDLRLVMEREGLIDLGVSSSTVNQILSCLQDSLPSSTLSVILTRQFTERLPYKLLLLRKLVKEESTEKSINENNVVVEVGTNDYDNWLDKIKDMLGSESEKRIWLTVNPRDKMFNKNVTGILGFAKSLRLESHGERIRILIDFKNKSSVDLSSVEYQEIVKNDLVYNYRTSDGVWGSFEHFALPDSLEESEESFEETEHVYLRSLKPGDLSSLSWVKNVVPSSPKYLGHHVQVHYSALNFKDVLFATGRLSVDAVPKNVSPLMTQDSLLGLEYSGIDVKSKERVMGILPFKALSTTIPVTENDKEFMWSVPDSWSLEDASTIPVVYSTVIYALLIRGKLSRGESILIHAGAGGVGLAAITVATHFECNIFTTVGSEEKKNFLLKHFQGKLNPKQILNSRDISFEDSILCMTNGTGVDVILNSLSDEKFDSSVRLLNPTNGRFLEIGKVDMINDKQLPVSQTMGTNQSFHGVFLDTLTKYTQDDYFSHHVCHEKELLKRLMAQGIQEGFVQPLPRIKFTRDKIQDAFRFMASGKHVGKVIIEMRDSHLQSLSVKSLKSCFMNPDKSYLVIGGLGGLGLELVQWLVVKGAKSLVINSRRGISNNYQKLVVSRLRREGIKVIISQQDSTNRQGVKFLIQESNAAAPLGLGGVFNSAVVYKDCLFSDQTVDIFEQASSPKSNATIFLDEETRESCPNLDYFVTFSSISAGRGNEGQTNYNFGNSMMDSVCLKRVNDGLPGLSVQWGVIGDVGLVADIHSGHHHDNSSSAPSSTPNKAASSEVVLLGSASQRVHSVFETLDRIINYKSMGCIASLVRPSNSLKGGKEGAADLMKIISNIIGLKDISRMDANTSLGSLGIDSLIAVEIKQVIERVTGVSLGIKEVRELTIEGITQLASNPGGTSSTEVSSESVAQTSS